MSQFAQGYPPACSAEPSRSGSRRGGVALGPHASMDRCDRCGRSPRMRDVGVAAPALRPTLVEVPPVAPATSSSSSAPGPAASSSSPIASDVAAPLRPLPASPDIELLRELASRRRPLSDVVDPARGVDVASEGPRGCDPDCPPELPPKRCSAAELEDVREWFENVVEHDAEQIDAGQGIRSPASG